ncbi:hypothetical protein [Streptomyces wuyuanensis]|uniref:hypothetical protein n=1 Tax=Streptomyces wuyuanensis TaxID=1196353 RepID=UPI0036AB806D
MGFCGTFCCSFCESPRPPDEGRGVGPPFAARRFGARLGAADRAGSALRVAEALTAAVTEGEGEGVGLTVADTFDGDGPGAPVVPAGDAAPPSPPQAAAPRARATRHTALGSARERARSPAATTVRSGERGTEGRLICYDL